MSCDGKRRYASGKSSESKPSPCVYGTRASMVHVWETYFKAEFITYTCIKVKKKKQSQTDFVVNWHKIFLKKVTIFDYICYCYVTGRPYAYQENPLRVLCDYVTFHAAFFNKNNINSNIFAKFIIVWNAFFQSFFFEKSGFVLSWLFHDLISANLNIWSQICCYVCCSAVYFAQR